MAIVSDDKDCELLVALLREAALSAQLAVHAYVVLPDSIWLLASAPHSGAMGRVMQSLGRRYVRHFNTKTGRRGALWDGRFRSTIASPAELLVCQRYIEESPVRAGLVADPAHYPFSSYRGHIGLCADALISDHELHWQLGNTPFERQASYRALFTEALPDAEVRHIRDATDKGWALGAPGFADSLRGRANRRALPLARGRPSKSAVR